MADMTSILLSGVNKFAIDDKGSSDDGIDSEKEEAVVTSPGTKPVFSQNGGIYISMQVGRKVIACF